MGLWTDAECHECGEEIKHGDRVVVSAVCAGNYDELEGNVNFDTYDIQNEIYHENCYHNPTDQQLPEKPCHDGSIAVQS
jgi:hypothetical protein